MSKIYRGTINFGGQFQPTAGQPLDDRLIVNQFSDLIAPNTFKVDEEPDGDRTWYVGMIVSVLSDNAVYMLIGPNPTVSENWKKVNPDLDISGRMVTVIEYQSGKWAKEDGTGSGEQWEPNPGAEPLPQSDNLEINVTYLQLALNSDDYVYIKSTDLIDLTDYYTKEDVDEKINALDSSVSVALDHLKDYVNTQDGILDEKINTLDSSLTLLKEYIDEQDTSIKNYIENEIDVINSSIDNINDDINELIGITEGLTDRVVTIDSSIVTIKSDLDGIHDSLSSIQDQVEVIDDHLDNIDSSINNLKLVDASLDATIEDVSRRLSEIEVGTVDSISTQTTYLNIDTSRGDVNINASVVDSSDRSSFPSLGLVTDGYVNEQLDKFNWIEVD